MPRIYIIAHRHGDSYLQIEPNDLISWVDNPSEATHFESVNEAKAAAYKYANGAKYGWIGIEKGVVIGSVEFRAEALVTEEMFDDRRVS
ncbi:MAG: hypothetical protein E6R03_09030 [Hyphomicrobiaceae bacterium]|nr:MAG: hypothetical protein E6R03_09030 [Hyphomicrobiaceae bacterium]